MQNKIGKNLAKMQAKNSGWGKPNFLGRSVSDKDDRVGCFFIRIHSIFSWSLFKLIFYFQELIKLK